MGRTIYCDPVLEEKLSEISSGTGVVVGSIIDDKYYGVFLAETPTEEEEKITKTGLDVGWMVEHAKQIIRLLPGGLTVLGFYIFNTEDIFEKQDGKVRKLLSSVGKIDGDVPEEQIVIVNNKTAKVFDSKASAFKNIDMKMYGRTIEFVRVDTSVVLDIPIAVASDAKDLSKDVTPGVERFSENLRNCIFVFDNQMFGDKHVIGKTIEVEKKKGKGRAKSEVQESSDLEDCSAQAVINLELLFTDSSCPADVVTQSSAVRLKFAGKVSSRSYLPPGATVQAAKKAIKGDLVRSLRTRLEMHCDTMQESEEEEEKKIVHEPPRRVFVGVGDPLVQGVAVCDYLYPGEGLEDCVNNMKEIFGWDVTEDSIEDDVEIVASPREVRPPVSPSPADKERQARRSRVPMAVVVSCGMAVISAGLAYLSFSD